MRKYDNILVPYDGAVSTEYTIMVACNIARWNDSHILVLAPFYPDAGRTEFEEITAGVRAISRREGVKMDVAFQGGRPSDAVIDVAYKQGNDLIVIGKTTMSGLEKLVIGSFTARIIGHASSDLLIIPENVPLRWRRILLCTDFSKYSAAAVDHAISYARIHNSVICALSVVDLTDEFYAQSPEGADKLVEKTRGRLEAIVESASAQGIKVEPYVREGDRVQKTIELKEELGADIIFMGSHERIGLGTLIMGSVARDVAMNVDCPVFIVKP